MVKIADAKAEQTQHGFGNTLRAIGVSGLGVGAGYVAADQLARKVPFLRDGHPGVAKASKFILPILSGAAVMLAEKRRRDIQKRYPGTENQ